MNKAITASKAKELATNYNNDTSYRLLCLIEENANKGKFHLYSCRDLTNYDIDFFKALGYSVIKLPTESTDANGIKAYYKIRWDISDAIY
jgi:hypothetical protein